MSISLSINMPNSAFVHSVQPSYMDDNHLSCPLLQPAAAANSFQDELFPSTNSTIIIRICTILFLGIISIWANIAASTSFDITIINDIQDLPARNRLNVFYISDDKATRIIQNSSSFIQNILCPKSNIGHVTLRFATAAATDFTSKNDGNFNELLINVSVPLIMGDLGKLDYAVKSMVLEGMARVWVSSEDRYGGAPPCVLDGIVEYVKRVAGYGDIGRESSGDFWGEMKERFYHIPGAR